MSHCPHNCICLTCTAQCLEACDICKADKCPTTWCVGYTEKYEQISIFDLEVQRGFRAAEYIRLFERRFMSKPKMSGDTSHFEKLLRQKHYGTMEIMRNKKAREAFKRPAYQTEVKR